MPMDLFPRRATGLRFVSSDLSNELWREGEGGDDDENDEDGDGERNG